MSLSIYASCFSYVSFLFFSPTVSTTLTWVSFWYSRFTSSHLRFNPHWISLTSSSDRHGVFFWFSSWRVWIILYSFPMSSFILCKYYGTWPNSFFFIQFSSSLPFFGIDKIFYIAFVTTKFLFDFNPCTGFSWIFGIGYFLCFWSYEKFLTGGRVSFPIVPVCFFRYWSGIGFRSPFKCPNVFVFPYYVWALSPLLKSPLRLDP